MRSHILLRAVLEKNNAKSLASALGLSVPRVYQWAEPPAPEGGGREIESRPSYVRATAGRQRTARRNGSATQSTPKAKRWRSSENTRLTDQIVAVGALVSEFPVTTFAAPQDSPIRNRIISGMSSGVLVVEAAEYSGAGITSRCALEQKSRRFRRPREWDR